MAWKNFRSKNYNLKKESLYSISNDYEQIICVGTMEFRKMKISCIHKQISLDIKYTENANWCTCQISLELYNMRKTITENSREVIFPQFLKFDLPVLKYCRRWLCNTL